MRQPPDSEMVRATVDLLFAPELRERVSRMLDEYEPVGLGATKARVQMAVLVLSNGDLERLEAELAVAKQDFRDVIVGAENTRVGVDRAAELARRRAARS